MLTSPRLRARRTSELAGHPDAEVDEDLVEWAYGDYEGITTPGDPRDASRGWSVWTHPHAGRRERRARSRSGSTAWCERARGAPTRGPLVFSHGHALRALAARWLGLSPSSYGRFLYLDTATISVLGHDRGSPVVIRWNA